MVQQIIAVGDTVEHVLNLTPFLAFFAVWLYHFLFVGHRKHVPFAPQS